MNKLDNMPALPGRQTTKQIYKTTGGGTMQQEIYGVQTDTSIPVFTASLLTIAKRWKQLQCSSTDEGINKTWYIRIMEYYTTKKRSEVLTHATTWMNLKSNMLSEI